MLLDIQLFLFLLKPKKYTGKFILSKSRMTVRSIVGISIGHNNLAGHMFRIEIVGITSTNRNPAVHIHMWDIALDGGAEFNGPLRSECPELMPPSLPHEHIRTHPTNEYETRGRGEE